MSVPPAPTPRAAPAARSAQPGTAVAALGVFLALLGLFVVTAPGRIDIIDGQIRYEVARNWLDHGRPVILDPALASIQLLAVKTPHGVYGYYNASASVAAWPLMALSRLAPGHGEERDRFVFSLVAPVFGAALGGLLVVAYSLLGLTVPRAVVWAAVACLATLWWPASTTVFDQNQHAVWLMAALLLAWQSGRRRSLGLATLAGIAGAALVSYQENYALLLPLVGLAVAATAAEGAGEGVAGLRRTVDAATVARYVAFGLVSSLGLLAVVGYNLLRFGAMFQAGRYDDPVHFGTSDPLAAALGLFVGPGKGVFLFSPVLVLALLGARGLLARAPALAIAAGGAAAVQVVVITQLAFFGGDWCWGPRYLLLLVPLGALALPFAVDRARRGIVVALVALGVLVQVLGLSLDHQRFFFERNLPPHFWASDRWFYLRESQLAARLGELAASWRDGVPAEARRFSPTPRRELTYSPFGPPRPAESDRWVRHFAVFYLPRPWPLWISHVEPARRFLDPSRWLAACAASIVLGAALVRLGARAARRSPLVSTSPTAAPAPVPGTAPRGPERAGSAVPAHPPLAPRARRVRWVAMWTLCAALLAVPFLLVEFPPVADLPQHLGQVRLFPEALAHPDGIYRIQWLTPYGLSYVLLGAAWAALPPETAGRAGMILLALSWTAAAHVLAARAGRPAAAAVLASLLFFNHTIYWGFYSFAFGWPVFVVWLLLTTRRLHAPARWTDVVLYFAGAAALYLSHALWFATGLAWLVLASAVGRAPLVPTLVRLAGVAPVVVVAAIWYPRLAAAGFDSPTRWFYTPTSRLSGRAVDAVLGGLRGPTEWVLMAVLVAWAAAGLWQHRGDLARAVNRPMALAAGLLATLALFLPDQYSNTIFFASRWAPSAAVLLLLAVPAPAMRPALRLGGAALVAVAFVGATAASWMQLEAIEYSGLREALAALPPRARVLGLDYVKESAIVKGRPFIQSFAYAQVYRGADINFSFAEFAPSPVVFRQPRRPPWTRGLEWYPERAQARDVAFFDYVLVNAEAAQHAHALSLGPGLAPATASGRWRLYRVGRVP